MKIVRLNYLLGLILCVFAIICQSAERDYLYTGEVPIDSQEPSARDAAMQQALIQVLTKLTGSKAPTAVPSAAQASQWAQQFRYEDHSIEVQFDQKSVDDFLKRNNVKVWSGERPLTLVWMAVEENGTQAIVGEYEISMIQWQQLFVSDSKARGIPVLFPLLDLTDQQQVALNDVWYHVGSALKPAASRYQAENTLSGRIFQNLQTQLWSADWLLLLPNDEQVGWQNEGSTPSELIKASVDRFANEMANRSEKNASVTGAGSVTLTIDNVNTGQKYMNLLSYLSSLTAIDTLTPIKLTATSVSLQLKLSGSLEQLQQQIAAGQLLQISPSSTEHALHYQYL
jgi:hypothetical protein